MCGIAAIYLKKKGELDAIDLTGSLVEDMLHRGPDQEGHYADESVAMGISRLAIVDEEEGWQPLSNEDGSLVLVCNGEIYNHRKLRKDLEAGGHRFRTGSDVEVIVHLFEDKGIDLLDDLAGMFAFLLWDRANEALFAARDRIGIKPLYYRSTGSMTVFASEMRSIVRVLDLRPRIDLRRTWEFLCYGFPVDNEATIDQQVHRLQPAEAMVLSSEGVERFIYWQPKYLNGFRNSHRLDLEAVKHRCEQSIAEHLVCEVPSAIMLSGGLDSASIAAFAVHLGYRPQALTIGYEGNFNIDEREKARSTAARLGLGIEEIQISSPTYATAFDELMQHYDEPVADFAAIPQWEIFKHARRLGYKVLYNGLGGDEIFYGYDVWNKAGVRLQQGGPSSFFTEDDASGLFFHPAYRRCRQFMDDLSRPEFRRSGIGADETLAGRFHRQPLSGPDKIYHTLFMTWLPNNCLLLADRLSMAHSVEMRVPLLDHRLVEQIQKLPLFQRFDARNGKLILKGIVSDLLGADIIHRPKQGFTPPGPYMFDLIRASKEIIFDGWLSRNTLSSDKMAVEWEKMDFPEIWFRILVFEKWHRNLYA